MKTQTEFEPESNKKQIWELTFLNRYKMDLDFQKIYLGSENISRTKKYKNEVKAGGSYY